MKYIHNLGIAIFLALMASSCNKDPKDPIGQLTMEKLQVPASFNWSTTLNARFSITALDNMNNPILGAKFTILTDDPENGGKPIVSGMTDAQGKYVVDYAVPAYYTKLYVATDYVGLPNLLPVDLTVGSFDLVVGGQQPVMNLKSVMDPRSVNTVYKYLGAYNSNGVPAYLMPVNDPITADFLADVNNTLPERVRLDVSHPNYFSDVYDHNVKLVETCDVWVTFVTEGAGYRNVLGFYTYPTGNPPATPSAIDSITIVFPNASMSGSGGGLNPGNKVYIGRYNANVTIGWVLIADGWNGSQVTEGRWKVYSDKHLNPAPTPALKQQTVLLYDPGREKLLLGMEDIRRTESGCDHDFNDAIFYVTANPIQAINLTGLPIVDYTGQDGDNDGVPDNFDDYPTDPTRAFNNYFFNQGSFGTLAFEDLWPFRGDYDFNDAVIDYNFNQVTNGLNQVVELQSTFILRAHGAYYHNGFGFELPVAPSQVTSITGTDVTNEFIIRNSNGTESNQNKAVIIAWDDAYRILPTSGNGIGVNTTPGIPFVVPDTMNVTVRFTQPIALNLLGVPPYNPFIFVDKQRGVEVHLPNKAPTTLADAQLLGTGHDNSIPAEGRYYKTQNNLPWAINIIERFAYPNEKVEVLQAHLKFAEWAQSGGSLSSDWFRELSGYRNSTKIYTPQN
ncbi:MAG: LruC domain-containing protein [Bacteroidales bacterium]|nr:LruC domain-containing protein [Bacteroidales bacterium]